MLRLGRFDRCQIVVTVMPLGPFPGKTFFNPKEHSSEIAGLLGLQILRSQRHRTKSFMALYAFSTLCFICVRLQRNKAEDNETVINFYVFHVI